MKTTIKHKVRLYATAIFLIAWLAPVTTVDAQNTQRYSNVEVNHRAGKWYRSDYTDDHQRSTTATTPNSDTFDEGVGDEADDRGMEVNQFGRVRMQKVHEYRDTIYMNPGETKTLTLPSNQNKQYTVCAYYQRWYNYQTDGRIDDNMIKFTGGPGSIDDRAFRMADGTYGGTFLTDNTEIRASLFQVEVTAPYNFNQPYYLACDQSDYKDVQRPQNNNRGTTFDEPTLGQRVIFIICPASMIKSKMSTTDYYETHDIHLPTHRTSTNTHEQVALNMSAGNYYTTETGSNGVSHLNVAIDSENLSNVSNYITLDANTISGDDRKIAFDQKRDLPDGTVVYINVTNNRMKIAQFKLTFDENTHGLTESEVEGMEENNELYYRTNKYLDANYELLTKLDFDFDNVQSSGLNETYNYNEWGGISSVRAHYYPYPLEWGTSTYAFYAADDNADNRYPQWGQYAITDGNGFADGIDLLDGSKYHLYVDANEYPGTVCELPFSTKFCQSSKLFVTAWVKSVNTSSNDAAVMFILKGVNDDGTTQILHTQSSGQIQDTGDHPWYQIYFEFVSPGYTFDNYVLEVFNNCASTTGGDFCVDDVRVYLSPLDVEAKSVQPLCTSEDEARIEIDINYERLLDRLALDESRNEQGAEVVKGYYSFVNKKAFDDAIASGKTFNEAFAEGVVHGADVYKGSSSQYYGTINFSTYFLANDGQDGMANHVGTSGGNRQITFNADVSANNTSDGLLTLIAGDEYYVAFTKTDVSNASVEELATAYEFDDIDCGIRGTFTVEGPLIVNVNGDVESDAETVCIGQQPLVEVDMRDGHGGIVEDAVFDWYFGSIQQFREEVTEPIDGLDGKTHTLEEALELFRHFYSDATSVSDATVPAEDPDASDYKLYQEDIDLIERLSEDYSVGGLNAKLTLSASKNLSIRLMQTQTYVVLIPVGHEPIPDEGGETQTSVCWEPTQILLHAQDGAPLLDVGRKDIDYSGMGEGYAVKVRLGYGQYNALNRLAVPVRNPRLDDGSATTVTQVSNDRNVYLTWTDDPQYEANVGGGYDFVIGSVENFTIGQGSSTNNSRVVLNFTRNNFTPREGFHYSVALRFTTNAVGEAPDCYGNLVIPIVIVPRYQMWVGLPDGNWNDDNNWRRAEPDEIKKTSNYITNIENGTSAGYVPLSTTNVVIPSSGMAHLYPAENTGSILDLDANKGTLSDPTENIEYDLEAAYNSSQRMFVCDLFETNECYGLHFDAGGQMLNSHLLTYERAWTNVEVPADQWTIVTTPLQGVFTGDWYTKTTGKENAEYFTDITFGDDNDRLQPYVLQRSWNEHAIINDSGEGVDDGYHADNAHTSNVTWSSTYNDVGIQTKPGEGFSILVGKGSQTVEGGKVEFRLPKWDTKFDGFDDTFQRVQLYSGKLFSDNLKEAERANVTVSPSHDGKYALIGNPFTSSLDMEEFFKANTGLDHVYWTTGGDPFTVMEGSEGWITSDGQQAALVPPYTAFYVRQSNQSAAPLNLTFSRDMAVMPTNDNTDTQNLLGMTLLASNANGSSTALLRFDITANNGFAYNEDVQLMTESTGVTTPMVYTVAGDMATSINRIKDAQQIPLGVFAADDDVTTLTFTGVAALMEPSLYDAEMNTDTPLTEGYTLTVNGASHGRYFIRAKGAGEGTTGITDVETGDGGVSVYSVAPRQVVVSSGAELLEVSVYSVGGAMLGHESVGGGRTAVTLDGIDSGVAVVRVVTADGQTTRKLVVK